jgi:type I restriction enzyme M protein
VSGLCKFATPKDVAGLGYSLNPGRYVGVVIDEDGKTAEDFIEERLKLNDEFQELNIKAHNLEIIIIQNVKELAGNS